MHNAVTDQPRRWILETLHRYGVRPVVLRKDHVPAALWDLLAEAELLGIPDDMLRNDIASRLSCEYVLELSGRLKARSDALHEWWLAEYESRGRHLSREYVAFGSLMLAVEYALMLLRSRSSHVSLDEFRICA